MILSTLEIIFNLYMTTIANIKDMVTPKLRGASLARVGDFHLHCKEAAGNVLLRTDPIEARRSARIANAIYSNIFNYVAPVDMKGDNSIIDIRPYGERATADDTEARFNREFDINRDEDTFTVEVINSLKTLRLSKRLNGHIVLATLDSLTSGQVVTGSGDVENLEINTLEYVAGRGALQFGLSGATGAAIIKIVLPNTVDLTTLEDVGALFAIQQFPDASRLTSIELRWGSDDANYWSKTVTSPHDRTEFLDSVWSLIRHDWVDADKTGAPDVTAINTLQVVYTYTAGTALTNVRLDNITAPTGKAYEVVYNSDYLFKSSAGVYKSTSDADEDSVMLGTDGINIFVYELMLILIQELGEDSVKQSAQWFENQLMGYERSGGEWNRGLYDLYNSKYPSQAIPQSIVYHRFNN